MENMQSPKGLKMGDLEKGITIEKPITNIKDHPAYISLKDFPHLLEKMLNDLNSTYCLCDSNDIWSLCYMSDNHHYSFIEQKKPPTYYSIVFSINYKQNTRYLLNAQIYRSKNKNDNTRDIVILPIETNHNGTIKRHQSFSAYSKINIIDDLTCGAFSNSLYQFFGVENSNFNEKLQYVFDIYNIKNITLFSLSFPKCETKEQRFQKAIKIINDNNSLQIEELLKQSKKYQDPCTDEIIEKIVRIQPTDRIYDPVEFEKRIPIKYCSVTTYLAAQTLKIFKNENEQFDHIRTFYNMEISLLDCFFEPTRDDEIENFVKKVEKIAAQYHSEKDEVPATHSLSRQLR